jgi:pyruvate-ferredoxin/flavodoxin oxidoreductase
VLTEPGKVHCADIPVAELLISETPTVPVRTYMRNETRFRSVEHLDPARFRQLATDAQREAKQRFAVYQQLAGLRVPIEPEE